MKKFTIKKDKEKLTEQEIQQNMNFDKFISGYNPSFNGKLTASATPGGLIISIAAAIVITVVGYFVLNGNKKEDVASLPFINPPIQSLTIPSTNFIVNTEMDSTLIYSTGTIITIPSSAFVDADGKDVKGKVEIHYREFHDLIDIMLSGIPMDYDSAGTTYQFESAGMFDITATQDGKPLTLKPNKSLTVNMISHTNNPTDFNIYNLDTVKKKWDYVSENTSKNNTCISAFEDRVVDTKFAEEVKAFVATNKPLCPKRASSDRENFTIDFDKNEFPELAVFSGLKFEPIGKNYNADLSKKVWDEVLVERAEDNEHYKVTFSLGKESHSFTVIPVVDENNYEAAMKDFAKNQKLYEMRLAEKKRIVAKASDSLYKINVKFERVAARSDLNTRFNSFINDDYNETSKDLLAYRTFAVSKLGIWNSDRGFPFFPPTFGSLSGKYSATFVSNGNKPLELKSVYLIRRGTNAMYLVRKDHFGVFPVSSEGVDIMVGITEDNKLVYLKDEEFKTAEMTGRAILFKMNKMDESVVSSKQLKEFMKL